MKRLLMLLMLTIMITGCGSTAVFYHNVNKTDSPDQYALVTTELHCHIAGVNGKGFGRKSDESFIRAIGRIIDGGVRTVALLPNKYSLTVEYNTQYVTPIKLNLPPLTVEPGHKYKVGYFIENQRIHFFIEDLTLNKVVVGKKES